MSIRIIKINFWRSKVNTIREIRHEIRERERAKICDKTTAVSKVAEIQIDSQFGSLIAIHSKKLQSRSVGTCGDFGFGIFY
jgi:hypothetical protein